MMCRTESSQKYYERLLDCDDHDPLAGVSNLFDVAMGFAAALLIALFGQLPASQLFGQRAAARFEPGVGQQAAVPPAGTRLERYRLGDREAGGRGERLGVAYRLSSGEVICVPESRHVGH
jgi:hypothetical protein